MSQAAAAASQPADPESARPATANANAAESSSSSSTTTSSTQRGRADDGGEKHPGQGGGATSSSSPSAVPMGPMSTPSYAYGFWSPALAKHRKAYLTILGSTSVICMIVVWGVMAIYWGSLYDQYRKSPNLDAWIVNRDAGEIGQNLTRALLSANSAPVPRLTWRSVSANDYPTSADVDRAVAVDERTWLVVEVAESATQRLAAARASGDASWQPNSVVSMVYSEARNQQTVSGLILNVARGVLTPAVAEVSSSLAAGYLGQVAGNATAVEAMARAPQTVASPVGYSMRNLRPWNQPVAIAPTFVGLIYLMILAFNITMAGLGARMMTGMHRQLRFGSYVALRILLPVALYFPISMMLTLLNVAFKLPYGAMGLGYGAGFMTYFCATWLAMSVLGLTTEAALALVTQKFIGFALIALIVINVSVASIPIELQVSLYKLGYALPFYNVRQIYVTVLFNTGRRILILKHVGILLAWLLLLVLTLPVWLWLEQRSEAKAFERMQKQKQQQQQGNKQRESSSAPPPTASGAEKAPAAAEAEADGRANAPAQEA